MECREVNDDYFSTAHNNYVYYSKAGHRKHKSKGSRKAGYHTHSYPPYLPVTSSSSTTSVEGRDEDPEDTRQRISSSEGDSSGDTSRRSSDGYMRSPSDGMRGAYRTVGGLYKYPSSESISTATSTVTVKATQHAFDSDNITDLLPADIRTSQGLTKAHVAALDNKPSKRYSQLRREKREERDVTSQRSGEHCVGGMTTPTNIWGVLFSSKYLWSHFCEFIKIEA